MNARARGLVAAGLAATALGAVLAKRRAAPTDNEGRGTDAAATNWTPVRRPEPTLRDARSML